MTFVAVYSVSLTGSISFGYCFHRREDCFFMHEFTKSFMINRVKMAGDCINADNNIAPIQDEEERRLVPGQDFDHLLFSSGDTLQPGMDFMSDNSEYTETLSSQLRSDVGSGTS